MEPSSASALLVKEIFVLRSIACLSIAMLHTIRSSIDNFGLTDHLEVLNALQMLMMYATPMFVFISEFVLARSKSDQKPVDFMKKRLKYMIFPYVSIAVLYSLIEIQGMGKSLSFSLFLFESAKNILLADYYGYFILVILQFSLLHLIFRKWIEPRYSMKQVIFCSFVINALYLSFFNFIDSSSIPLLNNYYIFDFLNTVPIFAWLFYFTFAFYCGKYYESFILLLNKYKNRLIIMAGVAGAVMLYVYLSGIIEQQYSKRVDVLAYATLMILIFFFLSSKIKRIPKSLMMLSQYSFGIYLLTRFILFAVNKVFPEYFSYTSFLIYIVVAFSSAIIGSIAITYLLNQTRYGTFVVGMIGVSIPDKTASARKETVVIE